MTNDLEEYVGEWVHVSGKDDMWILAELDIDDQTLNQTPRLAEVDLSTEADEPPDLLWLENEHIAISRDEWHPRSYLIGGLE